MDSSSVSVRSRPLSNRWPIQSTRAPCVAETHRLKPDLDHVILRVATGRRQSGCRCRKGVSDLMMEFAVAPCVDVDLREIDQFVPGPGDIEADQGHQGADRGL